MVALHPLADDALPAMSIEGLIRKRRSTQNYDAGVTIDFEAFTALADQTARGFECDSPVLGALQLHDQFLIVHAV